jgi:hypothetical protein
LGVLIGPVFCFGRQKNAVRIFVESTDDDDGRPTGARGNGGPLAAATRGREIGTNLWIRDSNTM